MAFTPRVSGTYVSYTAALQTLGGLGFELGHRTSRIRGGLNLAPPQPFSKSGKEHPNTPALPLPVLGIYTVR